MKKLIILDLMNLAYRAYYAHGGDREDQLKNSKGKLTSICYGVAVAIKGLISDHNPDHIVAAADSKGESFRHKMYPLYKSNRSAPKEDFLSQLPDLYRMIEAFNIPVVRMEATEADDIAGSLVEKFKDMEILIVSNDKDYMQLVGPNVKLLRANSPSPVGEEGVRKKFDCSPNQVVDCLALIGDTADAVPGVHGIGEKGAAKLIKSFGSIEKIYENLGYLTPAISNKLAKGKESAFLSKELVTIKKDLDLGDLTLTKPEITSTLKEMFKEFEFYSLLR